MSDVSRKAIPENISEEYYQIAVDMLDSFPKYRPPVDFFRFREDIASLAPLSRKGQRLSNEQVEEARLLCEAGSLFVARSDHPIYSEHIVKQVDLVLQDDNLKEAEKADICTRALIMRYEAFAEQTIRPAFDVLYRDMMVFTELIWRDRHRIKLFVRKLHRDHTLATHAVNTLATGLWLWLQSSGGIRRRDLDRVSLALFLQDIGMAKIPQFITAKTTPLKQEEKDKIILHPQVGYKIMQKMNLAFDELAMALMQHHERMDGSGYPQRLKGDALSKIGKIAGVADSFSAMVSNRPHAKAKEMLEATQELANDSKHYDNQFTSKLFGAVKLGTFGDLPAEDGGGVLIEDDEVGGDPFA